MATPRFTLFHSRNTRSIRILWTFEELSMKRGRDYALRSLRFPPRVHHPEYLSRNHVGTVPWFEHREHWDASPRAAMSESCAVPLYLAELAGSPIAMRIGDRDYGHFLNWLHHADATLTFPTLWRAPFHWSFPLLGPCARVQRRRLVAGWASRRSHSIAANAHAIQ